MMKKMQRFAWLMVMAALAWSGPAMEAVKTAKKTKAAIAQAKTTTATRAFVINPPALKPAGTICAGTRYATPYYIRETGVDGPRVVITGGVHGNEMAGIVSATLITDWPIKRGTILYIPRCNVPGFEARTRGIPGVETTQENLNRNFPRAGKTEPARGELAIALWEKITAFKPDWVIDLHEGFGVRKQTTKSVGSSVITMQKADGLAEARRMRDAVNATIADEAKHFVMLQVVIDGAMARAAGEHLKINAMVLETTSAQPLEVRTRQHRVMVKTLLQDLGMVDGNVMGE